MDTDCKNCEYNKPELCNIISIISHFENRLAKAKQELFDDIDKIIEDISDGVCFPDGSEVSAMFMGKRDDLEKIRNKHNLKNPKQ